MAQAIVHTEYGGPEVLHLTDIPDPVPGPGQVAIRVEAVGANPIDYKLRDGSRANAPLASARRVGSDGAGIVTSVGEDVEGFAPGDAVVFHDATGAYATDVVVAASGVWARPAGVSAGEGAALGIPAGTAYQSLRSLRVGPGDTLLVHGGSGSVGQAAVQFAVLWGATVIATTSDARANRVRSIGATPVAYGPGLADRIRHAAPDGVTVALDTVGTDEAIETSLELVADRDRIATIVRYRERDTWGIRGWGGPEMTPRRNAWRAEAIPVALALIAAKKYSVDLGPSVPLSDAAEAHRLLEAGASGKITLVP